MKKRAGKQEQYVVVRDDKVYGPFPSRKDAQVMLTDDNRWYTLIRKIMTPRKKR